MGVPCFCCARDLTRLPVAKCYSKGDSKQSGNQNHRDELRWKSASFRPSSGPLLFSSVGFVAMKLP